MSVKSHHGKSIGLASLVLALTAGTALAGGFQLHEQSAAAMGNSYAGAAASGDDASTIFYNPAAMTRLKGNQFMQSGTLIAPNSRFTGTGFPAGVGSSDAVIDSVVGSSFAFWDYSNDLKFGIGVETPFGLRTGYKNGWVGGPYALHSAVANIVVNPSLAYRITPEISIGAGVDISYTRANLSRQTGWTGPVPSGYAIVKGDDVSFGYNFGILWELSKSTRVGLAYRSAIYNKLESDMSVYNAARVRLAKFPAYANFATPAMASLGIVHDIDAQWTVKAGLEWTQWSSFQNLTVISKATGAVLSTTTENWRDTWYASVGLDYRFLPGHVLRLGAAYDMTPVKDAFRTARVPDASRYWVSAGYSYDFNKDIRLDFSYAHLFAEKAKLNETGLAFPLTGTYSGGVDILSAGVVYKF